MRKIDKDHTYTKMQFLIVYPKEIQIQREFEKVPKTQEVSKPSDKVFSVKNSMSLHPSLLLTFF